MVVSNAQIISSTPQKVAVTNAAGQKIITAKSQLLNAGPQTKVVRTSNLQQLLTQGGAHQKIILNQSNAGNQKIIISSPNASQQIAQPNIIQSNAPTQQIVINQQQQQPQQKVLQQYVNSTNQQQQVIVGGQRILLNPGQRIITQQPPTNQVVQQVIQQPQVVQQITQQTQITQAQPQQTHQIVLQRAPQSTQLIVQQPTTVQQTQQTQQVVVNNTNLAQQLAQGKLQVASVNGQQVIVKPMGNNQVQIVAQIKTQLDGQSHIVSNQSSPTKTEAPSESILIQASPQKLQSTNTTPVKINSVQQSINNSTILNTSQNTLSPTTEQSLLQGQPPGTVIKCVTAQVIQTQNGPRIVLQGLQGNDFTQQQLALVQQQVKQQLLKGNKNF